MNSRRRAILEAIVDSDDASASEKLQAIALLHGDGPEPTSRRDLSHLTSTLPLTSPSSWPPSWRECNRKA
jgi:hypothetical protein